MGKPIRVVLVGKEGMPLSDYTLSIPDKFGPIKKKISNFVMGIFLISIGYFIGHFF